MLTPSPCFTPNFSRENAFSFTSPQHKAGGFSPAGAGLVQEPPPRRDNTSASCVGLSDAEGVVWRVRVFFFPLNESNLINITIRSLVWKQCGAKFSNCSLCHITLGTFVHSAHLAPPALTLPSTPSVQAGTRHQWSTGLTGMLKTIKSVKSPIYRCAFGKLACS